MATRGSTRWGDDEELDDDYLPPKSESEPNADGIITVIEYKKNEMNQVIKVTSKIRRHKAIRRIPKRVIERRKNWKKFGVAAGDKANENITYESYDTIFLEDPNEEASKEEEINTMFEGRSSVVVCRRCGKLGDHWTLQCPYKDMAGGPPVKDGPDAKRGGLEDTPVVGAGGASGRYVPPQFRGGGSSKRGAASMDRDREESNTLRVTNISVDACEDDLKELFRPFGAIQRIYLATDKETHKSRGFAFVSFHNRSDAERALNELNGYGYDHLILRLEWARPSNRDPGKESGLNSKYVSGYGKALPQGLGKSKGAF